MNVITTEEREKEERPPTTTIHRAGLRRLATATIPEEKEEPGGTLEELTAETLPTTGLEDENLLETGRLPEGRIAGGDRAAEIGLGREAVLPSPVDTLPRGRRKKEIKGEGGPEGEVGVGVGPTLPAGLLAARVQHKV